MIIIEGLNVFTSIVHGACDKTSCGQRDSLSSSQGESALVFESLLSRLYESAATSLSRAGQQGLNGGQDEFSISSPLLVSSEESLLKSEGKGSGFDQGISDICWDVIASLGAFPAVLPNFKSTTDLQALSESADAMPTFPESPIDSWGTLSPFYANSEMSPTNGKVLLPGFASPQPIQGSERKEDGTELLLESANGSSFVPGVRNVSNASHESTHGLVALLGVQEESMSVPLASAGESMVMVQQVSSGKQAIEANAAAPEALADSCDLAKASGRTREDVTPDEHYPGQSAELTRFSQASDSHRLVSVTPQSSNEYVFGAGRRPEPVLTDETAGLFNKPEVGPQDSGQHVVDAIHSSAVLGPSGLHRLEEQMVVSPDQRSQMPVVEPTIRSSVIHQIVKTAKVSLFDTHADMILRLDPPHLGTIHMKVIAEQGVVTANLKTSTETVRQILEADMSLLRQSLADAGIHVDAISVSVGDALDLDWDMHTGANYRGNSADSPHHSAVNSSAPMTQIPNGMLPEEVRTFGWAGRFDYLA